MTDELRALKRIEALLLRIANKLDPQPVKAKESGAYVVAITRRTDGTVIESGDLDVPSQIETVTTSTVEGKVRRSTRIKGEPR